MTTYQTNGPMADDAREILGRIQDLMFGHLRDAGVTYQVLMAHPPVDQNDDPTGPALKRHGVPCHALVAVTPYKYRCMGVPDCQLYLDADWWDCLTTRQREALVHHECTHLELKLDKEGAVKRDDLDRPLFSMRSHDHEFGWFDSSVREFGEASNEFEQWQHFDQHRRQTWLFADMAAEDEDEDEQDEDHQTLAMDRRAAAGHVRRAAGA